MIKVSTKFSMNLIGFHFFTGKYFISSFFQRGIAMLENNEKRTKTLFYNYGIHGI